MNKSSKQEMRRGLEKYFRKLFIPFRDVKNVVITRTKVGHHSESSKQQIIGGFLFCLQKAAAAECSLRFCFEKVVKGGNNSRLKGYKRLLSTHSQCCSSLNRIKKTKLP